MDDGPVTFDVTEDLDGLHCEVCGGTWADVIGGAAVPMAWAVAAGLWLWALPYAAQSAPMWSPCVVLPLALLLLHLAWTGFSRRTRVIRPVKLLQRWREFVTGYIVAGALVFVFPGLGWLLAGILVLAMGIFLPIGHAQRLRRARAIELTVHHVSVDDERILLKDVKPIRHGRRLLLSPDVQIPMDAHAKWEIDWLVRRIREQVEHARTGTEDEEARRAVERLTGRVRERP